MHIARYSAASEDGAFHCRHERVEDTGVFAYGHTHASLVPIFQVTWLSRSPFDPVVIGADFCMA